MSDLCGAWTLDGSAVDRALPEPIRRRMAARLPKRSADAIETVDGRLWLIGPSQRQAAAERCCLASVGFVAALAPGSSGLEDAWRRALAGELDGHCVLVRADLGTGVLSLYRDPTGEERLHYARLGNLLLFSSSIKPLLAHPELPARLDPGVFAQRALARVTCFGEDTLLAGVAEVKAGHRLVVEGARWLQEEIGGDRLRAGQEASVADDNLKAMLARGVRASLDGAARAAVSLSGGVDSAAVAAMAVDIVGASNVHAFTYEFDEASHPNETAHAAAVCRSLGIVQHHVLRVERRRWLDARLAMLWWSEDFRNVDKAFLLEQDEQLKQLGFDTILTGDGVGSRLEWLDSVARWLPRGAPLDWLAPYWRAFWGRSRLPSAWLGARLPSATPPYHYLHFPLVGVLHGCRLIREPSLFFPEPVREAAARALASPRVRAALEETAALPLDERLRRLVYGQALASPDLARPAAMSRRRGVRRLAPTAFASCMPALLRQRFGKPALRRLLRGRIPEALLRRPKEMTQAVAPLAWHFSYARPLKLRGLPAPFDQERAALAAPFVTGNLHHLTLWRDVFLQERRGGEPPRWDELDGAAP